MVLPLMIAAVLGAALGFTLTALTQKQTVEVSSLLRVGRASAIGDVFTDPAAADLVLQTAATLANQPTVQAPALSVMAHPDLFRLSATTVRDTELLKLVVRGPDPTGSRTVLGDYQDAVTREIARVYGSDVSVVPIGAVSQDLAMQKWINAAVAAAAALLLTAGVLLVMAARRD